VLRGQSAGALAADAAEQISWVDTKLVQHVRLLLVVDLVWQLSVCLCRLLTAHALLEERQNHVLWGFDAAS
jgi:hypothetical protein